MKYSMMEAKLFPIQETRIPTNGPKTAPFKITMGSVGIGVAESRPISRIEKSGPARPVVGMRFSRYRKSCLKIRIRTMGSPKVIMRRKAFLSCLRDLLDMDIVIITNYWSHKLLIILG